MNAIRETVLTLLQNIGSAPEIKRYLREFSNMDSMRFAVIKVGGGIIDTQLDELASALMFLRNLGLMPLVVHGAGPQLSTALDRAGVVTETIDGLRVTSRDVLEIARRTFQRTNLRIVEALEARGVRARPLTGGMFEAEHLDFDRYGYVGRIVRVHREPIQSGVASGHLPVIACLAESSSGQILNVNADAAARELTLALQPSKVIFLTPTGGLLDDDGAIIPAVNLVEDYDALMKQPWLHSGMRLKLQQIKELLDRLPHTSSVSITSPEHLARELFTHRGAGTLIRHGESIRKLKSPGRTELDAVEALIRRSFGRSLAPGYFDSRTIDSIYLSDSETAGAIVTREHGVPYLDKFAVTQEAQGLGLGGSLWQRLKTDCPRLYWRAKPTNPITQWYFTKADGAWRNSHWVVFWYGMSGLSEIERCVSHALSLPETLTDASPASASTPAVEYAHG